MNYFPLEKLGDINIKRIFQSGENEIIYDLLLCLTSIKKYHLKLHGESKIGSIIF